LKSALELWLPASISSFYETTRIDVAERREKFLSS
jgi:hypothetical protein